MRNICNSYGGVGTQKVGKCIFEECRRSRERSRDTSATGEGKAGRMKPTQPGKMAENILK